MARVRFFNKTNHTVHLPWSVGGELQGHKSVELEVGEAIIEGTDPDLKAAIAKGVLGMTILSGGPVKPAPKKAAPVLTDEEKAALKAAEAKAAKEAAEAKAAADKKAKEDAELAEMQAAEDAAKAAAEAARLEAEKAGDQE